MRIVRYATLCCVFLQMTATAYAQTEVGDSNNTPLEFVWAFTLTPQFAADAWSIELTPEIMQRLNRSSADDLMIFDAQNRPVPFARVPASMLRETVPIQRALVFEGSHVQQDQQDQLQPELSLEFEHNGARLSVNAPESESRAELVEALRYQALLALSNPDEFVNDAHRENPDERVEFARLQIEFQTEQRINLQCWLRSADDNEPATRSSNLRIEQESRPLRYRGHFNVPIREQAWHLACYGPERAADDLELIEAEWSRMMQLDYQSYHTLLPELVRTSESPEVLEFELPGPYRADQISLATSQPGVFSRLRVSSRGVAEQAWTRRGEMTLSTLENANNRPLVFDRQSDRRDRFWKIEAEPPLGHIPAIQFDGSADTIVFLAQGEAPWELHVGSYAGVTPQLTSSSLNDLVENLGPVWLWPEPNISDPERIGEDHLLYPPTVPIEWSQILLWLVLMVGSLIVVVMAFRLLRSSHAS